MTARFEGRIAAVTGAGSGLGRATAEALSREGARLLLFDRSEAKLRETAARCGDAVVVVGDVTSGADMERAAATAAERLGPVELLATAAGINGPLGPAVDASEEDWDRLFAVNVKGTWLAIRSFLPQMRQRCGGSIVTFASAAGLRGSPALQAYSASKGAVVILTRSLAVAHAPEGIRINAVCPGSIDTPLLQEALDAEGGGAARTARAAAFQARHPLGRFGTAGEVAASVLFLLSDDAEFTTGVALPVDGGRLA